MNLSRRAKLSAYIVAGAYSVLLAAFNVDVPGELTRLGTILPVGVVAVFALFDKWLWRVGPFPQIVKRPDLRGTWFGELTSTWRDENDVRQSATREVALVLRQDFTTVSVTLLSAESKSISTAAEVAEIQSAVFLVTYQYQNTPKMPHRARSPVHSGGAQIEVSGYRPERISGEYWTARDSHGTYFVRLAGRRICGSFDEARKLAGH